MNHVTTTYTFRPAIFAVVFLSVFAVSLVARADASELRVDAAGDSTTATCDEMFAAQKTNGKCNALFA